jgi:hypothetical protein
VLMTSPDPVPFPPAPLEEIVTTEGRTSSATCVTAHPPLAEVSAAGADDDVDEPVEHPAAAAPIKTTPAPAAASAPRCTAHRDQRCPRVPAGLLVCSESGLR